MSHSVKVPSIIFKLGLALVSILLAVILVEVYFRLVLFQPKLPYTDRLFERKIASTWPHSIPIAKDQNTYRILGLSDSFGTVGQHENYHYILESFFRKDGLNVEVVNISVGALEPSDQLKLLKRFGVRYHPDLVLHGFTVGNDFNLPKGILGTFGGVHLRIPDGFLLPVSKNFPFFSVWLPRYWKTRSVRRMPYKKRIEKYGGRFPMNVFLNMVRIRFNRICRTSPPRNFRQTLTILSEIMKEVGRIPAEYLIVIHPEQIQVETELLNQIIQKNNINMVRYDLEQPQKVLSSYCAEKQILCLDLFPSFREVGSAGGLYLPQDTHYNNEGNKLAAKMIYKFLLNNRFIVK